MSRRLLFAAATLTSLALGIVAGRHGTSRLRASHVLRAVEVRTVSALQGGPDAATIVIQNVAALRAIAELDPAEVGIPVALGSQYLLLGRYASAAAAYEQALRLEVRPETYLNLGRAMLGSQRRDDALDAFERAVLLSPRLERELSVEVRAEVAQRVSARLAARPHE